MGMEIGVEENPENQALQSQQLPVVDEQLRFSKTQIVPNIKLSLNAETQANETEGLTDTNPTNIYQNQITNSQNFVNEAQVTESNNQEIQNQEMQNQEMNNQEMNNQEMNNQEIKNQEMQNQEMNNQEMNNQEMQNQEMNNQEIQTQEIQNQAEINNQEMNNPEMNNQEPNNLQNERHSDNVLPQSVHSSIILQPNPNISSKLVNSNINQFGQKSMSNSQISNQNNIPPQSQINQENIRGSRQNEKTTVSSLPPENQSMNQQQIGSQLVSPRLSNQSKNPEPRLQQKSFIEQHSIYHQQNIPQQSQLTTSQRVNDQSNQSQLIEQHSIYRNSQKQQEQQDSQTKININQEENNEIKNQFANLKVSQTRYLTDEELAQFNQDNDEEKNEVNESNINKETDANNLNENKEGEEGEEREGEGVQTMNPPNPIEQNENIDSTNNIDTNNISSSNKVGNLNNMDSTELANDEKDKIATSNILGNNEFIKLSKTQYVEEDTKSDKQNVRRSVQEREMFLKEHPVKILKIEGEEEGQMCPDFISKLLNKFFG